MTEALTADLSKIRALRVISRTSSMRYKDTDILTLPTHDFMPQARTAALRALELDDTLAEGHAALAMVKFFYDWNWSGAEKDFLRAIELDPGSSAARHRYANYLWAMERLDEATEQLEKAQDLDPLSLLIGVGRARTHYFARRFDKAIEGYRG